MWSMFPEPRRIGAVASIALGALLAAACSDEETVVGEPPPTEIAVDPLEFLGDLPCSEDEGAARAFVAVLTDETEGFTLGASLPSPCSSRVAFRYVVIGHAYSAEVDVYDRPASELFSAGGNASGSRVVVDATGEVVAPRWRTRCGVGPTGPAVAVDDTSVVVAGCEPLAAQGAGTTALVVDPATALGALGCTADGGEVDTIRVSLASGPEGAELPTVTVACGSGEVRFDREIAPGAVYTFGLEAFAEGAAAPTWGSTCVAVAAEGVARRASCEPLSGEGAIRAGVGPLLGVDFSCGVDFHAWDLSLEGPTSLSVPRTGCEDDVLLSPVPPGRYEGTLRTFEDGTLERTATCAADVAPARTAELVCSR